MRPQDEQRGVYSDNACIRATMVIYEREARRKKEADVPWQKHPSRSAEAPAPCAVVAFLVSFLGCWLEVDEERRPSRSSSSLRTAMLRGGGSGVAAFAFPFAFSDFVGWGDLEGGRMRSERREPRETHGVPRRGGIVS
jgi:hypothetical protein